MCTVSAISCIFHVSHQFVHKSEFQGNDNMQETESPELLPISEKPEFPRMFGLRQKFPASSGLNIVASIQSLFQDQPNLQQIKPGQQIAVAVGSRGITNLTVIVSTVLNMIKTQGAMPFIVAAMGSHGGGTEVGQREVLATYGITEERLGVPIRTSIEVSHLGATADGIEVNFSSDALSADGIIIINRVKPHTDFRGAIGSGIMKMMAIGLGKRKGAATCHAAASEFGHEHVIRTAGRKILESAPILGGIALLEDQQHQTARIEFLSPERIESAEEELLKEARALMPTLPFKEIDLLIVDQIGKNISGAGMDPNVIGRAVQGYAPSFVSFPDAPRIGRLFVRDLSSETHGNAVGIGLADFTTVRAVRGINKAVTYLNALTALTPQCAKIPVHFDSDREAIAGGLASLALKDIRRAKVVRILDTLSLEELQVSEAYIGELAGINNVSRTGDPCEMQFDSAGNLFPLAGGEISGD